MSYNCMPYNLSFLSTGETGFRILCFLYFHTKAEKRTSSHHCFISILSSCLLLYFCLFYMFYIFSIFSLISRFMLTQCSVVCSLSFALFISLHCPCLSQILFTNGQLIPLSHCVISSLSVSVQSCVSFYKVPFPGCFHWVMSSFFSTLQIV